MVLVGVFEGCVLVGVVDFSMVRNRARIRTSEYSIGRSRFLGSCVVCCNDVVVVEFSQDAAVDACSACESVKGNWVIGCVLFSGRSCDNGIHSEIPFVHDISSGDSCPAFRNSLTCSSG